MIVTLKKAHALSLSLAQIKAPIPVKLPISIHAASLPDIANAHSALITAVFSALNRTQAVYEIRDLVQQKNAGRINTLVTQRARIDKQLDVLNALPAVTHMPVHAEIQSQIDAAKAETFRGSGTVTVELPTDFAEQDRRALRRERIQVEDELAQLNFSTTVELPPHVVTILREHDLV